MSNLLKLLGLLASAAFYFFFPFKHCRWCNREKASRWASRCDKCGRNWMTDLQKRVAEFKREASECDTNDQRGRYLTSYAHEFAEEALQLVQLLAERQPCNGSCDIALARRQVGPDGEVPGNARECAELWEREAARLAKLLAEQTEGCAFLRAELKFQAERLMAEIHAQGQLLSARDAELSESRAEVVGLREKLSERMPGCN